MREFFRSKFFKAVMIVLALLLGFMIYAISQKGIGAVTSQIIGAISSPFQQLSSYLSETTTDFLGKFVNAEEYYNQNQALREELAELREELVEYDRVKRENEQLKELAGLKEEDPNIQLTAAMVVARDPSERFGAFTIDKGALHGIEDHDTVITSEGLVGVVTEVGEVYSKVTTILSPELSPIGVIEQGTGEIGTISGTIELSEKNQCKLSYLNAESEIEAGDIIVTSGTGGIYPKNIVVGIAGKVETEEHGITACTTVTPAFDIKTVKQVFVITDFYGKSRGGES